MSQHGKITGVYEPRNFRWATHGDMEKSREYLGLETTVSRQGQITIPSVLMRRFNIKPHDKIRFTWLSEANNKSRLLIEMSREGKRMLVAKVLIKTTNSQPSIESQRR